MTCTECKYQWCWLCEGECNDGHFSTGKCNGLQFAKINHIGEKENKVKRKLSDSWDDEPYSDEDMFSNPRCYKEYHGKNKEARKKGCFLCNDNIIDKIWMISTNGPQAFYYGNTFLNVLITLLSFIFLFVPIATIMSFIEIPSRKPKVNFNRSLRIIAILLAITSSICFMIPVSCLVLSFVIIVTPIYPINPCKYIIDNMEDYDGGWVY